ncbi:hypothetical protein K461DRAFT_290079 [Myriangium duriaei CBS 260.36]|uniref:Methyltransferase domain-containing protein n=1 Tax=Myriangium duriaei CBS 260.36 TaxID=1168546 RepID=A0A9P4JF05_9PEZI|nr:hypothetical protein K461DRAFT_290079 [Myriangium duriaei CBS 260.36]
MDLLKRSLNKISGSDKQVEYVVPSPFEHVDRHRNSTPPWYRPDEDFDDIIAPETYKLLSKRTGLDGEALKNHVLDIRRRAWRYGQYPAIGGMRFLRPTIQKHPYFSEICSRLKNGASMLIIGPGLGQDLEFLIANGAPCDRMYAVDNRPELWKLGQELFGHSTDDKSKDRDKLGPHFIAGSVTHSTFGRDFLKRHGQVDIILSNHFFDSMDDVYGLSARRWLRPLLKPGTIVAGYQIGAEEPFESDGIIYNNRVTWWGDWIAIRSENRQREISMELDLYETVSLKDWGLQPQEWNWHGRDDLHGVYWVVRRDK